MANMIPISTVTVGASGASTIAFTNIPQIYTDLLVKVSGRSDRGAAPTDGITITLNGTAVSSGKGLYGNGSSAVSDADTIVGYVTASSATASTFGNAEFYIPNYSSTVNKSISGDGAGETNATTTYLRLNSLLVPLTSPVTSISLGVALGTTYVQYSSATLYGIRKY